MNVKGITSKLLVLKKSATFILITTLLFTNCNQIVAQQDNLVRKFLYMGPPTVGSTTSTTSDNTTTK